jgi:hypothetical protein
MRDHEEKNFGFTQAQMDRVQNLVGPDQFFEVMQHEMAIQRAVGRWVMKTSTACYHRMRHFIISMIQLQKWNHIQMAAELQKRQLKIYAFAVPTKDSQYDFRAVYEICPRESRYVSLLHQSLRKCVLADLLSQKELNNAAAEIEDLIEFNQIHLNSEVCHPDDLDYAPKNNRELLRMLIV